MDPFSTPQILPETPQETWAQIDQAKMRQLQMREAQQQLATGKLDLQQKQQDLDDQQTMRDAWQQAGGNTDKFLQSIAGRVSAKTALSVANTILDSQQKRATIDKDKSDTAKNDQETANNRQKQLQNAFDAAYDTTGRLMDIPDDNDMEAQYHVERPKLLDLGVPASDLPEQFPGRGWIAVHHEAFKSAQNQKAELENNKALKQESVSALQQIVDPATGVPSPGDFAAWDAKYKGVRGPAFSPTKDNIANYARVNGVPVDKQPDYDIAQAKADAVRSFKANPQEAIDELGRIIDPKKNPEVYGAYLTNLQDAISRGDAEEARNIRDRAAQYVEHKSLAMDPDIMKAEVQKDVAKTKATAPIEIGKAIATAKALRMGDNPAVAHVAPGAIQYAQSKAFGLDEAQIKANEATEAIGQVLDMAEQGNKAAGSNLPVLGVGALNAINGIKRFNQPEIRGYGNAGSLMDKIDGEIGKLAVGKPIPNDVLEDFRQLHQVLGESSYKAYLASLKALNDRTSAEFPATVQPPNIRKSTVKMRAPNGQVSDVPAGQVAHYKSIGAVEVK